MIRRARQQDVPMLIGMLREMLAASKYAGRGDISEKAADALLTGAIAQQGQRGPQGSFVAIAEEQGEPVGFMVATLDRVYGIGNKLTAMDYYLYVRDGAGPKHVMGLVDGYIEWASAIRPVVEIMLSWSDALPGAEKIAALATRKGFVKSGEMFEMRLDTPAQAEAA